MKPKLKIIKSQPQQRPSNQYCKCGAIMFLWGLNSYASSGVIEVSMKCPTCGDIHQLSLVDEQIKLQARRAL